MYKSMLLIALLASFVLPTNGRGLDLSDPNQVEICAWLAALTQTIAEQAAAHGIPANRTEAYRTVKSNPALDEAADMMALMVDRLDGRLSPHVVRTWSMYGYCHGFDDDLLFGEAATKVGAACNVAPDGAEHQCIEKLLSSTFDALPSKDQELLLESARQRGY